MEILKEQIQEDKTLKYWQCQEVGEEHRNLSSGAIRK